MTYYHYQARKREADSFRLAGNGEARAGTKKGADRSAPLFEEFRIDGG
jgi:hypothetical protein